MKRKLWNKDFGLLMQGKFVSNLGDILYSVALSFWILQTTGSKSLMGILLASQTLVKVVLAPFGGVFCDRINRKKIIVWSDFMCGFTMISISILGFMNSLEVWMIFVAGIIMAVCGAIFEPAMSSVFPDLIEDEDLSKGLSIKQGLTTIVQIIGQSISGILLSVFGPIYIFLGNGISFFFSSFSESFIRVPKKIQTDEKLTFFEDFKSGLSFVYQHKGLLYTIVICCLLNFFGNGIMVLLLPYFLESPQLHLETGYGIAMACITAGTLVGVIFYGVLKIDGSKRSRLFSLAIIVESIGLSSILFFKDFTAILIGLIIFGMGNAILNVVINEIQYEVVPNEKRGKVFALIGTVAMGLTPISMALFSILSDAVGTFNMIAFGSIMVIIVSMALVFSKEVHKMIRNKPSIEGSKN